MDQQLIDASEGRDLKLVIDLLDRGANPNAVGRNGITPLHRASAYGRLEVVIALLDRGADPNISDEHNETSLYKASQNGYLEVVIELLDRGADPNFSDGYNETPLYKASQNEHLEVVIELLNGGADPTTFNEYQLNTLQRNDTLGIVKLIKSHFPNLYFPDLRTLSMRSIRKHRIDITSIPESIIYSVKIE